MTIKLPFLLLFSIFFYYNNLYAQSERIDSLIITNSEATIHVFRTSSIPYANHGYYISNDTCYLNVCYYDGQATVITHEIKTLPITLPSSSGDYVFKLTTSFTFDINNCDDSIRFDSVMVNFSMPLTEPIILSTNENVESNQLTVYPNPAADIISFEIDDKVNSIELIDLNGRKIKNFSYLENKLYIQDVQKGVYLIKFNTSKGFLVKKIIIEK